MNAETLLWLQAADELPDADTSVLIATDDDVAMGWHDGQAWRDCATGGEVQVKWWAKVTGPEVRRAA